MHFRFLRPIIFSLFSVFFSLNSAANEAKICHTFSDNDPCEDEFSPGILSGNQTICLENNLPAPILSLSAANNGVGAYEYMWIKTTVSPDSPSVIWLSIPGATNATYSPPPLLQTTWFRRCARPVGCLAYSAESSDIKITVESCVDPCEEFKAIVVNSTPPTCHDRNDGRIELSVEGGESPFIIQWNGNNATDLVAENLASGYFSVEITDANGCYTSQIIQLDAPEELKTSAYTGDVTCFNANDGWVTLSIDGGTAPYTAEYNGIATTDQEIRHLSGGVHAIAVTDKNGCENEISVQLFEPALIELTATATPETCMQNDGTVEVTVLGGLAPFDFSWSNDAGSQNLEALTAGNYSLAVVDRNDCAAYLNVRIDDDCAPLSIDFEEFMLKKLDNNAVKIDWMAHNETPSGVFLMTRSLDGENFEIIGEPVYGKNFCTSGNTYFFMDDSPKDGLNYYQIRHYDQEGNLNISATNSLFFEDEHTPEISIFPNPFVNEIQFDFLKPTEDEVTIQLNDSFGKTIATTYLKKGLRFGSIDATNLPSGIYYTQISNQKNHQTQMIIKE